jgi:hypothetical protein
LKLGTNHTVWPTECLATAPLCWANTRVDSKQDLLRAELACSRCGFDLEHMLLFTLREAACASLWPPADGDRERERERERERDTHRERQRESKRERGRERGGHHRLCFVGKEGSAEA